MVRLKDINMDVKLSSRYLLIHEIIIQLDVIATFFLHSCIFLFYILFLVNESFGWQKKKKGNKIQIMLKGKIIM